MTDDHLLRRDARRFGVRLAAQRPRTVALAELEIRWAGKGVWVLRTKVGTPVAFSSHPLDLKEFARDQLWHVPRLPMIEELPLFTD